MSRYKLSIKSQKKRDEAIEEYEITKIAVMRKGVSIITPKGLSIKQIKLATEKMKELL